MSNTFQQVTDERYEILMSRYAKFQVAMSSVDLDVVRVFDPLTQKQLNELDLIRDVSKDLQKKKQEDLNKAAQAAEEEKKAEIQKEAVEEAIKEDA